MFTTGDPHDLRNPGSWCRVNWVLASNQDREEDEGDHLVGLLGKPTAFSRVIGPCSDHVKTIQIALNLLVMANIAMG